MQFRTFDRLEYPCTYLRICFATSNASHNNTNRGIHSHRVRQNNWGAFALLSLKIRCIFAGVSEEADRRETEQIQAKRLVYCNDPEGTNEADL